MKLLKDARGNAALGWLAALVLILCVGAVYDVYAAYHYRTWGYQVAGEAARAGTLTGMGLDYERGDLSLDSAAAQTKAEAFLREALVRQGLADYTYEIRAVTDPAGGIVPGFPPVAGASLDGLPMSLSGPGVGVYLEFTCPTAWLGLINREGYRLHVFSSAEAAEVGP